MQRFWSYVIYLTYYEKLSRVIASASIVKVKLVSLYESKITKYVYDRKCFCFRGRTSAAGLSAAICYMFGFLVTNTFMTIKLMLTLPGSFFVYGAISLLGFVFIYFFLPETEGKTLQDIETNHFNKNKS